jgi:Domain of unknown function (DUF4326)
MRQSLGGPPTTQCRTTGSGYGGRFLYTSSLAWGWRRGVSRSNSQLGKCSMNGPVRIQLARERGWKMPPNTIRVDRTSKFGNPFSIDRYGHQEALALHRSWITGELSDEHILKTYSPLIGNHLLSRRKLMVGLLPTLIGKDLACWCPTDCPCHADTLIELANSMDPRLLKVG